MLWLVVINTILLIIEPPKGFAKWSLRLFADKVVELKYAESISHETVRRILKKRFKTLEGKRVDNITKARYKDICSYDSYERKLSLNNKYCFVLKTSTGQIIGNSEMYETKAGMENGIESVKKDGRNTKVVEEEPYY